MLSGSTPLPSQAWRGTARTETAAEVEHHAKPGRDGPRSGKCRHGMPAYIILKHTNQGYRQGVS